MEVCENILRVWSKVGAFFFFASNQSLLHAPLVISALGFNTLTACSYINTFVVCELEGGDRKRERERERQKNAE